MVYECVQYTQYYSMSLVPMYNAKDNKNKEKALKEKVCPNFGPVVYNNILYTHYRKNVNYGIQHPLDRVNWSNLDWKTLDKISIQPAPDTTQVEKWDV